jgi:hypothetical protein
MQNCIQKIAKSKKGWGHNSSGRAPECQAQGPELKSQYHTHTLIIRREEMGSAVIISHFRCSPIINHIS